MSLELVPVSYDEASRFGVMWHRHHKHRSLRPKFCVGVAQDGVLVGCAVVGLPIARVYDDGQTLEVSRSVTDGTSNANSMLYGAAWRAAKALGYTRLITYTQEGESGASLRAAGWREVARRPARGGWGNPSRPRDDHGLGGIPRTLWEAEG